MKTINFRFKSKQFSRLIYGLTSLVFVSLALAPLSASALSGSYPASDVIGQLTNGNPDFTTNTDGTSATTLNYPDGTALDSVHHRLFVSDNGNNRVLVYNLDSNNNLVSHTAAYVLGQTDFVSNGSSTTQSTLNSPYAGLVYDSTNDRLFVSDDGNGRVMVFDLAGGITNGMNASYVLGEPDFTTDNSVLTQSGMASPEELAFDPINQQLFVADYDYQRVTVYNVSPSTIANGENASYVLGQSDFTSNNTGTTQNSFHEPESVAYNDVTKQLFVGDSQNDRVLVFDLAGGITNGMNASYVLGQPDFTSNTSSDTQNGMSRWVEGMGVDNVRNILYVYDDDINRILVFDLAGGITNGMNASAVLGQVNFTSDDYTCDTSATTLCDSEGNITVDTANDRIYVPDADNNRVLVYDFAHITTPAGLLTGATTGKSYSQSIASVDAQCTETYSVTSGSLPPGLTLNATTGLISGTPTSTGSYQFEVAVNDNCDAIGIFNDDPSYTIDVANPPVGAPNTGFGTHTTDSLLPTMLVLAGTTGLALGARFSYRKK